jgi:hypothetical protein
MKTRFLIILAAVAVLSACSTNEFKDYDFSNYTIDKVVCEAGSAILVADNISELDLHVKLYSQMGTYTDRYGQERPRYMEIPRDRWRNHNVKFFLDNSEITPPYKTSSATPSLLRFRAEVDGIRSSQSPAKLAALFPHATTQPPLTTEPPVYEPDPDPFFFEVTAVEPYVMPTRKIPVVFHIIDTEYNRVRGQILDANVVYDMVNAWNDVFGRKNSTAPAGGNANIEFVPAVRNPSGGRLAEQGINRVYLSDTQREDFRAVPFLYIWNWHTFSNLGATLRMNSTGYTNLFDNGQLNNRTPLVYYRTDRYLNVWIFCEDSQQTAISYNHIAREYLPTVYPEGVYDADEFPLPSMTETRIRHFTPAQMTMWQNNPGDLRLPPEGRATFSSKITTPRQVGLMFIKNEMTIDRALHVTHVGAFLGLVPSGARNFTSTHQLPPGGGTNSGVLINDFCNDTPTYNRWFAAFDQGGMESEHIGNSRVKYTVNPPYYIYSSTNIMEINSSYSSITPNQLMRIDWVLNNVPGRMMWKDLTAIDQ